jgi:hypothetical protein
MNETMLFGVLFAGLYLIAMLFITRMMLALIAWGVVGLANVWRKEKMKRMGNPEMDAECKDCLYMEYVAPHGIPHCHQSYATEKQFLPWWLSNRRKSTHCVEYVKTKYMTAAAFYNAVSKPLFNQYQEREKRIIDVRILGTGQGLNF